MNVKQHTMYYINVLITLFYEIENMRRMNEQSFEEIIQK